MDIKKIVIASESQHSWTPNIQKNLKEKQIEQMRQYLPTPGQISGVVHSISNAASRKGIDVEYLVIDDLESSMEKIRFSLGQGVCVWILSDGHIFNYSSRLCSWLKLMGVKIFGSDSMIQGLTDNKYLMSLVAKENGILVPSSYLYKSKKLISSMTCKDFDQGFFVKPNCLGSQIGISGESRTATMDDAIYISEMIYEEYGVESIIQSYIPGSDHRICTINIDDQFYLSCLKVKVKTNEGSKIDFSTNRTIHGRTWEFTEAPYDSQSYTTAKKTVSTLEKLGLIRDYAGIDIRGTDENGYMFIENNVKPFPDNSFKTLSSLIDSRDIGEIFLKSIISSCKNQFQ